MRHNRKRLLLAIILLLVSIGILWFFRIADSSYRMAWIAEVLLVTTHQLYRHTTASRKLRITRLSNSLRKAISRIDSWHPAATGAGVLGKAGRPGQQVAPVLKTPNRLSLNWCKAEDLLTTSEEINASIREIASTANQFAGTVSSQHYF